MRIRTIALTVTLALGLLAIPLPTEAQQSKGVGYVFFRSMVMVSTTAVFFRRCATLTVINCPVFASRPLVIVYVFLRFAILCYLIYGILPTSRRRPDAPPYNTAYA